MDLLFRSISKVRRSINPGLKIDGILMTMVDGRTNNARDIISALRESVGRNIRIYFFLKIFDISRRTYDRNLASHRKSD